LAREVKRRFDPYQLHPWTLDKEFLKLLRTIETTLPLRLPSYMWKNRELAEWLLEQTDGILSEIIHLIKLGAREAILSGEERITLEILKRANPRVVSGAEYMNTNLELLEAMRKELWENEPKTGETINCN